jgi:hypothetical protein
MAGRPPSTGHRRRGASLARFRPAPTTRYSHPDAPKSTIPDGTVPDPDPDAPHRIAHAPQRAGFPADRSEETVGRTRIGIETSLSDPHRTGGMRWSTAFAGAAVAAVASYDLLPATGSGATGSPRPPKRCGTSPTVSSTCSGRTQRSTEDSVAERSRRSGGSIGDHHLPSYRSAQFVGESSPGIPALVACSPAAMNASTSSSPTCGLGTETPGGRRQCFEYSHGKRSRSAATSAIHAHPGWRVITRDFL